MAGLDPAIYVDPRDKPGNNDDEIGAANIRFFRLNGV
jgi:hypothetical protein